MDPVGQRSPDRELRVSALRSCRASLNRDRNDCIHGPAIVGVARFAEALAAQFGREQQGIVAFVGRCFAHGGLRGCANGRLLTGRPSIVSKRAKRLHGDWCLGSANRDLVEAIRASKRGEPFLYPKAVTALIRDYLERARGGEDVPEDPLTPRVARDRETDRRGAHQRGIAEILVVSRKTVERHRANVLE